MIVYSAAFARRDLIISGRFSSARGPTCLPPRIRLELFTEEAITQPSSKAFITGGEIAIKNLLSLKFDLDIILDFVLIILLKSKKKKLKKNNN